MKSTLGRERAKSRPAIPKTLRELGNILQTYKPVEHIYIGSVTASDGMVALLFSTPVLLEALSRATDLLVDGTFAVSKINNNIGKFNFKLYIFSTNQ